MPNSFCIVGRATDGPSNVPLLLTTSRDVLLAYGGGYGESFSIAPTASSVELTYIPRNFPQPMLNGKDVRLFSPAVSGNVFQFGSVGGSGTQVLDLLYIPYLGRDDLIVAGQKFLETTGLPVYLVRAGGEFAYLDAGGLGGGMSFESRWPGSKYNRVKVQHDRTLKRLTISGMEPEYKSRTYVYDLSPVELVDKVNKDAAAHLVPVRLVKVDGDPPTFSGQLSGGTDGGIEDALLMDILQSLPSEVSHLLVLSEATSGLVEVAVSYNERPENQPVMIFVPVSSFTPPASSWVSQKAAELPDRSNFVSFVVGLVTEVLGNREFERYGAEAAFIGFAGDGMANVTNVPVPAYGYSTNQLKSELDVLKKGGFMALTKRIRSDLCIYEGVNSANEMSFLVSSRIAEVSARARTAVLEFLGLPIPDGPNRTVEMAIESSLVDVPGLTGVRVSAVATAGQLLVTVDGQVFDEILSLSFSVRILSNSPPV